MIISPEINSNLIYIYANSIIFVATLDPFEYIAGSNTGGNGSDCELVCRSNGNLIHYQN